jgi:hypothetical protein
LLLFINHQKQLENILSNINAIYKNHVNMLIYNTNNKYQKIQNIQKCNYNVLNNKYVYL